MNENEQILKPLINDLDKCKTAEEKFTEFLTQTKYGRYAPDIMYYHEASLREALSEALSSMHEKLLKDYLLEKNKKMV